MTFFQRAIDLAENVNLDQVLLPAEWSVPDDHTLSMPVMTPCVRDALQVFGGERFEGRSHLALGLLHMQRGSLEAAEEHLDSAAQLGEPTADFFRQLGEQFDKEGLSGDAMRAHLKAFSHGGGIGCLEQAVKEFRDRLYGK
jgi:hypothetical protein